MLDELYMYLFGIVAVIYWATRKNIKVKAKKSGETYDDIINSDKYKVKGKFEA